MYLYTWASSICINVSMYWNFAPKKKRNIKMRFSQTRSQLLLFWAICLNCVRQKFCSHRIRVRLLPYQNDRRNWDVFLISNFPLMNRFLWHVQCYAIPIFQSSTQKLARKFNRTIRGREKERESEKKGETHSVVCWFNPFPKPNNIFTIIQVGRTCFRFIQIKWTKCLLVEMFCSFVHIA